MPSPLVTVSVQTTTTQTTKKSVREFLLVFQRYLNESEEHGGRAATPPLFTEGLLGYVDETSVCLKNLDDTFHLKIGPSIRCDSTATKALLEFSTDQRALSRQWTETFGYDHDNIPTNLIGCRVVREYDGDQQVMDVTTGNTASHGGHYMSSADDRIRHDIDHKAILPTTSDDALPLDASTLLREHWIAPHKWWPPPPNDEQQQEQEGIIRKRARLVRSSDFEDEDDDRFKILCPLAKKALIGGYTLFMAPSPEDVAKVQLPGRHGVVKLKIAGMMWKEEQEDDGDGDGSSSDNSNQTRNGKAPPCCLTFIIPESACRRRQPLKFEGGMLAWGLQDEYQYVPGLWR